MELATYKRKRNFDHSPEPQGKSKKASELSFVVQRHKARRLHYDFRLEVNGVLKSWAVPKGPSMNPGDKRLAMMVEDHPFDYKDFKGVIPEGNYGAGIVEIWDNGHYSDLENNSKKTVERKMEEGIQKGNIKFRLYGQKLAGEFALVKIKQGKPKDNSWLLIKHKDEYSTDKTYNSEDLTSASSPINKSLSEKAPPKKSSAKKFQRLSSFNIKPMLAQEVPKPFDSDEWIYEIKWDGYRAIAEVRDNNVLLYSRNSNSFNNEYPLIIEELKKQSLNAVLDGEIVLFNNEGKPDFGKLQDYRNNTMYPLCFYVFDILFYKGEDVCNKPLIERKNLLRRLIKDTDVIRYTDHIIGQGTAFFESIKEMNMEGIMAKRMNSLYYPGKRSTDWLKIKQHSSREVVIIGFTKPAGERKNFGSLVLAYKENDLLHYAGHVGTGFSEKTLQDVYSLLEPLITSKSPITFKVPTKSPITWVKPKIICEVKYSELTKDKIMRHPVFVNIIKDKTVTLMEEKKMPPVQEDEKIIPFGKIQVKVTHLNKIFFPDDQITKGMIIDYYNQISEYILPYLKDRPQSLKRNPNGITDHGFYHKNAAEVAPAWVEHIKLYSESSQKDIDYIICNNKPTLMYMNNLGCIEINPWSSTTKALDNPDYLILDLDPSEGNTFYQVVEAALAVKSVLDKAKVSAYCKTSGATGLHIYVPMGARYSYDEVKDFANIICMLAHDIVPDTTSMVRPLNKRGKDKIYLDYLQNRRGQTIASVYSVRPYKGANVSTPLDWKEVKSGLNPADFNIFSVPKRIEKTGDLFNGILGKGIELKKALKALGA